MTGWLETLGGEWAGREHRDLGHRCACCSQVCLPLRLRLDPIRVLLSAGTVKNDALFNISSVYGQEDGRADV